MKLLSQLSHKLSYDRKQVAATGTIVIATNLR